MLSAVLYAADLGGRWTAASDGWVAGNSFLRPYLHPALHAALFVSATRLVLSVRERNRGAPANDGPSALIRVSEDELDRVLSGVRVWPLEFLVLSVSSRAGAQEVRLEAGHWGTAPAYLLARDGVLRIEWDVTQLYRHLRSTRVDPSVAAEYIVNLDYPNSRRTLFPDITRLTERATATWRAPHRHVVVRYPAPAPEARAGHLARGADVPGLFREILAASMRRWTGAEDGRIALELSGGLDSSVVAASAAAIAREPVRSFGLLMPGTPGRHQQARRACVVRRCGLRDRTLHCVDFPPFAPESRRIRGHTSAPWEEFYDEATSALLGLAGAAGARTIFTGMGGDELASLQAGELDDSDAGDDAGDGAAPAPGPAFPPFVTKALRDVFAERERRLDEAPSPLLYSSTVESATAVSAMYLRAGFWPVSPLCTPELVHFCRRLPFAWRNKRRIHREVLTSFGLPARVAYPRPQTLEHFSDVMEFALRRAAPEVIGPLFAESRLAQQGLIDGPALAATYAKICAGETDSDAILGTLMLELTLRSVEHHRQPHHDD